MAEKKDVPAYLFLGFLESGKSRFINETLRSEAFNDHAKTLLIACEVGEEEYDEEELKAINVDVVYLDEEEEFSEEKLEELNQKYQPEQVMIEYNGMWSMDTVLDARVPEGWMLVQIITTVNSKTFETYLNNMRGLMMEHVKYSQLVIFNRCTEEFTHQGYARTIRAVNRMAQVVYENENGDSRPADGDEDLPYNLEDSHLDIADEDFGIFYMDIMDNPKKYEGKTVTYKGMIYRDAKLKGDSFVLGRFAMTCCADDIAFVGLLAKQKNAAELPVKSYVTVTADIRREFSKEYKGKGPVLYVTDMKPSEEPEERVVYF